MTNCKRCGKKLSSVKSIELGYGKTCYRIITLQEESNEIPAEKITENTEMFDEMSDAIKFLKCEIKMMKIQMKSMKQNGIVNTTESIERIKQEVKRPEQDSNLNNMANVRREFEELVSSVSETHQLLTHIETNRPSIYIES